MIQCSLAGQPWPTRLDTVHAPRFKDIHSTVLYIVHIESEAVHVFMFIYAEQVQFNTYQLFSYGAPTSNGSVMVIWTFCARLLWQSSLETP